MPIHDFSCPTSGCKYEARDYYLPRLDSEVPTCPEHKAPLEREWTTNRMYRTFQAFSFTLDSGEVVAVDSLAKLRRVEKESGDAFARGEGRPFVFRHYSQDPSNSDAGIFRHLQPKQIDPKKARSMAGAMGFGTFDGDGPAFHPATLRALESQGRNRSRSR